MGDVNFGQHSQLLTNSPLPPSHIWELLSAGGGLTQPITEPQPGGVYVTNMDSKGEALTPLLLGLVSLKTQEKKQVASRSMEINVIYFYHVKLSLEMLQEI